MSRLLAERGALVVDADRMAREVVEPGTPGLTAIRERFGAGILTREGALDRAALGALVFVDPASRRALEDITHPLIRARTEHIIAAATPETVVVNDVPLLVETGGASAYHLVVVVDVEVEERVRRLVSSRGMAEADARARIANQASREARLAVADVVVDNNGPTAELLPQVDALWRRLEAYDAHLRAREACPGDPRVVGPDPAWPDQARRHLARLAHRLRPLVDDRPSLHHIGPTAVPGVVAPDVLHLQVGLPSRADLDREDIGEVLDHLGHPRAGLDVVGPLRDERVCLSCDPGRPVVVHLRTIGSPAWRTALLARDWLRADSSARAGLIAAMRGSVAAGGDPAADEPSPTTPAGFPAEWWASLGERAEAWAATTGWSRRD